MATLCVTEIREMAFDPHGNSVLAPKMPPVTEQPVAIGAVSVQSNGFQPATRYVMIETDTTCCLAWGDNPTAVSQAHRMVAGECRFYGVDPGDKVAVIASA